MRRWIHRYNTLGPDGLGDRSRAGRPRRGSHQVLAGLHHTIAELPDGAVVLAEDETHVNLLAWIRSTWIANGAASR